MALALNIVFVPADETFWVALNRSEKIAEKYPTCFQLAEHTEVPHMTLYKVTVPEYNLLPLQDAVQGVVGNNFLLNVPHYKFSFKTVSTGRGYVFAEIDMDDALREFEAMIVKAAHPFRDPRAFPPGRGRLTEAELYNNRQYGHWNVLDTWKPHMTITRLKDETMGTVVAEELQRDTRFQQVGFQLGTVRLYKTGNHGTCRELVDEFLIA